MEISKTIQSATKAGKSVGDVVAQISDGGQIIAEGSKAVLGAMGQAIGGIGAGIAVLDIARQGYLINKFRNRKKALKAAAVGLTLEENQQAALDFICQTLTKRQKRAAREIFFDSLNVVGGVLTATGMGSAAGIAISATALTLKLGHAAFKFTRQRLRNYLAKKREHLESYAEWSARQKAIKGGLAGKKAFMKRVFMPNWDKSTDKKAAEYTQHAQTVLGLLEQHPTLAESALHGLGVATNAKGLAKFKKLSEEKKFKSIVDAMKKR